MKSFGFGKTVITVTRGGIVLNAPDRLHCMHFNQLVILKHRDHVIFLHGNVRQTYFNFEANEVPVLERFLDEVELRMCDYISTDEINQKQ